jgi:hypothetical protein
LLSFPLGCLFECDRTAGVYDYPKNVEQSLSTEIRFMLLFIGRQFVPVRRGLRIAGSGLLKEFT